MFSATRALRFGDCDPAGIAYYPNYLRLLDSVVEEFFEGIGLPRRRMIEDLRLGTPTVTLDLAFESPGFYGETLQFALVVRAIGRSSLDLAHGVHVGERRLWTARHRLVATSLADHKSCPWPDDIRTALTKHLETTDA